MSIYTKKSKSVIGDMFFFSKNIISCSIFRLKGYNYIVEKTQF